MKKLLFIAVSFILTLSVHAQDKMDKKMDMKMSHPMPKNCVMMEDGKMMQMKNGKSMIMDHDMKFSNGSMVMTNGSMKMKNGKTMMLTNGDCVMMNGKMIHMKMKKMDHSKM